MPAAWPTWVVVERPEGHQGMLVLSELHKCRPPRLAGAVLPPLALIAQDLDLDQQGGPSNNNSKQAAPASLSTSQRGGAILACRPSLHGRRELHSSAISKGTEPVSELASCLTLTVVFRTHHRSSRQQTPQRSPSAPMHADVQQTGRTPRSVPR